VCFIYTNAVLRCQPSDVTVALLLLLLLLQLR
jgi:hypothetical protein